MIDSNKLLRPLLRDLARVHSRLLLYPGLLRLLHCRFRVIHLKQEKKNVDVATVVDNGL